MPVSLVKLYAPARKITPKGADNALVDQLAGFIASERLKQGLSQKELAEKSGTPQSTIARVLGEKVSSKIDTLLPILEVLGYTLSIVPIALRDESDVFSHKNIRNMFDEYTNALSILSGITEIGSDEQAKVLFNVVSKQRKFTPERVRTRTQWDGGKYYAVYQDIVLADYNRPLSVLLEVVKHEATETEGERVFAFIKNEVIGLTAFGTPKFDHYFEQIKFYLEGDDSDFPIGSYTFLDSADGDEEFNDYLRELLDYGDLEENEVSIVNQIIEEGYASLRPHQKIEFIENVLDQYYVEDCERCGNTIPWCEMYMAASTGDSFCSYCRNIWEKMQSE